MASGFAPEFVNGLDPVTKLILGNALSPTLYLPPGITPQDAASRILVNSYSPSDVMASLNHLATTNGTAFADSTASFIQNDPSGVWSEIATNGAGSGTEAKAIPKGNSEIIPSPQTPFWGGTPKAPTSQNGEAKPLWKYTWDDVRTVFANTALGFTVGAVGLVIILLSILIIFYRTDTGKKVLSTAAVAAKL